jgi:hypothetical protein
MEFHLEMIWSIVFIFCTKVNDFNRRFLLVKKILHNLVLRPTAAAPFSSFVNPQAATMKRFSYNTTGLSPVLKKPHPNNKGQDKRKEGTQQEQPWFVQGSKKEKTTTNNKNYKQQLVKTYSSAVSSVGPLSLSPQASVREIRNR